MTPATLSKTSCYHCGTDCPAEPVRFDEKAFCCDGCKTVYEVLNASQLCQYYDLTEKPGQSPRLPRLEFLDNPEIASQLLEFTDGTTANVTFYVPAIHCSSCLYLLENLYRLDPAIRSSRVDFMKKHVHVTFRLKELSLRGLAELLTSLGYEPLISLNDVVQESEKPSYRPLLYRLAVAGFCSGNIMLFSFPEYLGLDDPSFRQLFGYLNLLLATPVVFYSGSGYFTSVWKALRRGMINIDLPILVGILSSYSRTVYEVLGDTGAGYADSVSGLIFFLLTGQWFQQKTYAFLSFERDYKSYFPLAVTKLIGQRESPVPVASLRKGDRIRVRSHELIPADGILYKGKATIDYSFVTGESEPEVKQPGTLLYAGGKQLGEAIELEVVREVSQSYLTQLWNNDAFRKEVSSRIRSFSDAVGRWFTYVVLTMAFLVGGYWYSIDPAKGVNAFTAILIVACPCVLSLAYPFALGHGMRIFGRQKFYLKNADVMEQLAACDTIVFDKTGTLTSTESGRPREVFADPLDEMDRSLIASLVRQSAHPLSRKLATYLDEAMDLPVENFAELSGQGIKGLVYGQFVKIGSRAFVHPSVPGAEPLGQRDAEGSAVHVSIDHIYRGCFRFQSQFRPGVADMLLRLQRHQNLYLLSGDNASAAVELRTWFPQEGQMLFECHPQQKLDFIRSLQARGHRVLMIGDGLNDAGALKQADVGVAVTDDTIQFTPSSDAILEAGALNQLPTFLRFSRFAMRLIHFSFAISLIYNCIGLSFALTANLAPIVAAILMPISSATMVLIATIGMRIRGRNVFGRG